MENRYLKPCPYPKIDLYRVFQIFNVTDPAVQQAIKKLMMAGQRGHKDYAQDLKEARQAIDRKLEMLEEDKTPVSTKIEGGVISPVIGMGII